MTMKKELGTYCELFWWNCGQKTKSFHGDLGDLLKEQCITYTKRKTENEGLYTFTFKNPHGIRFKQNGQITDFSHLAKQFIQMELVRMGDRSELKVIGCWRPIVTVNK